MADDHELMRTDLRKMIEEEDDMIAEASNEKEAVELTTIRSEGMAKM